MLANDVPGAEHGRPHDDPALEAQPHEDESEGDACREAPGVQRLAAGEFSPVEMGAGERLKDMRVVEAGGEKEIRDQDRVAAQERAEAMRLAPEKMEGDRQRATADEERQVVGRGNDPSDARTTSVGAGREIVPRPLDPRNLGERHGALYRGLR